VHVKKIFKRHPMWAYLFIAYAFSWTFYGILLLTTPPGVMQQGITTRFIVLAMLGGFGPSVAGVLTIAVTEGKPGLHDLFNRIRNLRVGTGWFLVALLFTPIVAFAVLAVERILGMPTAGINAMMATLPLSIIWPLFAALGEEFGWRGFYLPSLQKRYSALTSSMIVGVAWGLWHVPTIFLAYRQFGVWVVLSYVLVVHIVAITAQSLAMTWVHNNTRQSLLMMIVFHYSLTGGAMFVFPLELSVVEGLQHQFVYAVSYWLAAGLLIVKFGPNLSSKKE